MLVQCFFHPSILSPVDLLQHTKYFKGRPLPCLYIVKKAKLGSAESFICKNSTTSERGGRL